MATVQTDPSAVTSSNSRDSTKDGRTDSGASGSAAGSSSSVERPRVGGQSIRIGDKDRDSSGDSCSFYALETGAKCRKARTCYDCLNTAVSGAQGGCVLTPQGFCQTMDRYDYNADFRRNFTNISIANSWYNFYPSINSTYCRPSDAACVRCRQIAGSETTLLQLNSTVNVNSTNTEESRQFCRGADGCVCVVACEYSMWNTTVAEDCPNEAYVPTEVEGYRTWCFLGCYCTDGE
uniref:Uncharacterized protein n=1 Tax=Globisporangium ultimum (strain ATCC 200006 / CBS 805.95 / DAOM BR144) TaxID=431595 RepID=K3X0S2_GLOUD